MMRKTIGLLMIAVLLVGFTAAPVSGANNETTTVMTTENNVAEETPETETDSEEDEEQTADANMTKENEYDNGEIGSPNARAVANNGWLTEMFDKIETISQNSGNMTGQEIASIATSIHVGINDTVLGNGDDKRHGVGHLDENPGNSPDTASERPDTTESRSSVGNSSKADERPIPSEKQSDTLERDSEDTEGLRRTEDSDDESEKGANGPGNSSGKRGNSPNHP